jgi:hypothetical protein
VKDLFVIGFFAFIFFVFEDVEIVLLVIIIFLAALWLGIMYFLTSKNEEIIEHSKKIQALEKEMQSGKFNGEMSDLAKAVAAVKIGSMQSNGLINQNVDAVISDIHSNGALIIDKPWIELILSGQKSWEMRTTKFKKLGYIALVEKGTKTITGIARIDGYTEQLSLAQLEQHEAKHRVLKSQYTASDYKWFTAMKLSNVLRLERSIKYEHKNGTVIWVKLSEQPDVIDKLKTQLNHIFIKLQHQRKILRTQTRKLKLAIDKPGSAVANVNESKAWLKELRQTKTSRASKAGKLPVCKAGHVFSENNATRVGLYHLKNGEKEYRFESFKDALSLLKYDETLQWAYFTQRGRRVWKTTYSWQANKTN